MIGWTDMEVRNFDLKMRMLASEHPEHPEADWHTFWKVNGAVSAAKRDNADIECLRLDRRTWEKIQHTSWVALTNNRVFGCEVELVEGDPELIEVVEKAEVLVAA